jgi:hypothetical protein
MAVTSYDATIKTADGKTREVNFVHVNFNGSDDGAKTLYERLHGGTKIVKIKRLGLVAAGDVKKLADQLDNGESVNQPEHIVNG